MRIQKDDGLSPDKRIRKGKAQPNFLAAWDDVEQIDVDFATEQVLCDEATFDIIAERGYETLPEYPSESEKKQEKVQEFEL